MAEEYTRIVRVDDMPRSGIYCAPVAGGSVAVCRVQDEFFAVSNQCTHAQSSFAEGRLRAYRLICPLHGAMFDLRTGKPLGALTKVPLTVYPTRVSADGFVEVAIPPV